MNQPSGRPTSEETEMIRDVILYPHILQMIHKSQDDIGAAHIALKGIIGRCLDFLMSRATNDYYELKRSLKARNIRVVEEEANEGILYFRYFCRGYEERFGIVRETLRHAIIKRMNAYTQEIGQKFFAP